MDWNKYSSNALEEMSKEKDIPLVIIGSDESVGKVHHFIKTSKGLEGIVIVDDPNEARRYALKEYFKNTVPPPSLMPLKFHSLEPINDFISIKGESLGKKKKFHKPRKKKHKRSRRRK